MGKKTGVAVVTDVVESVDVVDPFRDTPSSGLKQASRIHIRGLEINFFD